MAAPYGPASRRPKRSTPASASSCWTTSGELRRFVKLFVNGDQLERDALDSPVASDDTISVLAAAAGG